MTLSPEQLKDLKAQGFLNVGPLFSAGELEVISREYDRLVDPRYQVMGNKADGVFPYRAMLNFRSPELARIVLHPELVEVAAQILGDDIRLWWDQGINKTPGARSPIEWHQDNGYTEGLTQEFLTCWLALDDSDLDNGGLEVIPGSAAGGQRLHEWRGVHSVISEEHMPAGKATALNARAGEMLLFSSWLVHRTVGNLTSDRPRRSWVIQYCEGGQHNTVTKEVYDDRAWVRRRGMTATRLESERRHVL